MKTQIKTQLNSSSEQYLRLPGYYSWQKFKTIEAAIEKSPGLRIFYLDGCVEIMTIGEQHEMIKTIIGALIELFFLYKQIEFIPVGSATRESEDKNVSFQPDESYYIGEQKDHPDLAVEVVISSGQTPRHLRAQGNADQESGNIKKLDKYKRLQIAEVWFWENNQLSIHHLREEDYEEISQSELLPNLDINLLTNCVQMPSKLAAMTTFSQGIQG